ncbi:MAG: hypothetical protein IJD49_04275 [Clostridia bacterium]|nr:hypothetical protein [Clostridia bacterium]
MGFIDAIGPEERLNIKYSDFYALVKQATEAELMMNAINCDVPHKYIRETMSGIKESE